MINSCLNPIQWKDHQLFLLDQRYLPSKEEWLKVTNIEDCFHAIRDMVVRGAPCIGYTAIFGLCLWAKTHPKTDFAEFEKAAEYLKGARPTAVNLEFEINRCLQLAKKFINGNDADSLYDQLILFGLEQMDLAGTHNLNMAQLAEKELVQLYGQRPLRLMTHCNTGYLACGSLGTALGVITHLHTKSRVEKVWVDETRPYMQGSRLTSYELSKLNIPHHIVVEGAASYLMREKLVDAIFVGADRIVKNGDTANKIGTSTLAIVAKHYGVPFYVVAPTSSFDLNVETGEGIEIELRNPNEILEVSGVRVAPQGSSSLNPSFDVTTGNLISAIFCEKGIIRPQNARSLTNVLLS